MRNSFFLAVALAAAIAAVSLSTPTSLAHKRQVNKSDTAIAGRYIVVLDGGTVGSQAVVPEVEAIGQYLASVYGGRVTKVYATALKGFVVEMNAAQAEAMLLDPSVISIEQDRVISVANTETSVPWHLDRIDQHTMPLDAIYSYTSTGTGVHVYILDTGIRYTHSDFGGRANAVYDIINDGQNGNDCHGHGTHVAGIIGSATYGVAKGASLHAVRVLACSGSGELSNLVSGVDWLTGNRQNPAVANISITAAGSSTALETAIANSIASGVVYTISAGNSGLDACSFTPGSVPDAITIGATSDTDIRPNYSNHGSCIDIFAPGHMVTSLSNANDIDTRIMSGTSQASPLVAGVAALYLSNDPTATAAMVTYAIKAAATRGLVTNIDTSSANLLLYSKVVVSPSPTPTPSPTATPTPTPVPTVTPKPKHPRGGRHPGESEVPDTPAHVEDRSRTWLETLFR